MSQFIRRKEACCRAGLSYPTLYRQERAGLFPKRRKIGVRAVGWLLNEVEEWIEQRQAVNAALQSNVSLNGGRSE